MAASTHVLSVLSFSFLLSPIHSFVHLLTYSVTRSLTFSLSSILPVVQLWTATLIPFSFAGQVEPILVSLVAINQPSASARWRPRRSTGILSSVRPPDSWPDRSFARSSPRVRDKSRRCSTLSGCRRGLSTFRGCSFRIRLFCRPTRGPRRSIFLNKFPPRRFYTFGTRKSPRVIDTSGWRERDVSAAVMSDAACASSSSPRVFSCYSSSSCFFPHLFFRFYFFFSFSCARVRVLDSFAQSRGEKWKFRR